MSGLDRRSPPHHNISSLLVDRLSRRLGLQDGMATNRAAYGRPLTHSLCFRSTTMMLMLSWLSLPMASLARSEAARRHRGSSRWPAVTGARGAAAAAAATKAAGSARGWIPSSKSPNPYPNLQIHETNEPPEIRAMHDEPTNCRDDEKIAGENLRQPPSLRPTHCLLVVAN